LFMPKTLHNFIYIFGVFFLLLMIGTMGYSIIEGWSFNDSFYMTVITITTVGFGEVAKLSEAGRYFTVFIVLMGFSFVALLGTKFTKNMIEGEFTKVLGRKTMKKNISKLRGHFIICGHGRIGSTICDELEKLDIPIVITEYNEVVAQMLESKGYNVIQGDSTSDEILKEAGIERAAGIISVVSKDSDNLFIALSARELNRRIFIIARGEDPDVEVRMLRAGADVVVSPYQLGGQQIAHLVANRNSLEASISASAVPGFSLKIYGIRSDDDKRQKNRILDNDVKNIGEVMEKTQALKAVSVKRKDGSAITLPDNDTSIGPDDSIVLLFSEDM
ncbi:potassium channel family protein, partial [Candidatus Latescibacterota bacterium]